MKQVVVIACPVATRSGYGAHSREVCRAIINSDKYDVKIIPVRWGSTPQTALNPLVPEDKIIIDRFISGTVTFTPDIFIQITIPNEFQPIGKYNIGITAGIETTRCRPEWIEGCNKMDVIVATSQFTKDVFMNTAYDKKEANGRMSKVEITKPIVVISEGLDLEVFSDRTSKGELTTYINETIPEDFCFLFAGHWLQGDIGQDRKDVGMLVKLFMESFLRKAKRNRPALILKTSMAGFSIIEKTQIEEKLQSIRNMIFNMGWKGTLPNVYVIYGELTDSEMNELYNHPKVMSMVSLHKGEGFGKTLLEFTRTGKPLIASNWSGPVDFLNPNYSYLLPGKIEPVHRSAVNDFIIKESEWFTVDYAIASKVMREVHENYQDALTRCKPHKKYTAENFSFSKMMNEYVNLIENIESVSKSSVTHNRPVEKTLTLPKLKMVKPDQTLTLPKAIKKV